MTRTNADRAHTLRYLSDREPNDPNNLHAIQLGECTEPAVGRKERKMSIKIYGHSDDCIEVDGIGESACVTDEFYINKGGTGLLLFDKDGKRSLVLCTFGESKDDSRISWDFNPVEMEQDDDLVFLKSRDDRHDDTLDFKLESHIDFVHAEAWPWFEGATLGNFPYVGDVRERIIEDEDFFRNLSDDQVRNVWLASRPALQEASQ